MAEGTHSVRSLFDMGFRVNWLGREGCEELDRRRKPPPKFIYLFISLGRGAGGALFGDVSQERAKRRQGARQQAHGNAPRGGSRGDPKRQQSRAPVSNPFKQQEIVSKFDVNDIRKIEFVGSFVDDESAWPQVGVAAPSDPVFHPLPTVTAAVLKWKTFSWRYLARARGGGAPGYPPPHLPSSPSLH